MTSWILDAVMPTWTYHELHSQPAPTANPRILAAIPTLTWADIPTGYALMRLRMALQPKPKHKIRVRTGAGAGPKDIPANKTSMGSAPSNPATALPHLDKRDQVFEVLLRTPAFRILRQTEDEFCFGGFYPLKHGFEFPRDESPDQRVLIRAFREAAVPGSVKVAAEFALVDGRLVTETRVQPASARENRWFRFYWAFIRLGSGLIRRSLLKAALKLP
jgi:hypothetical protein